MDVSWTTFAGVALGIGLAAATGFRVFVPLLVAGLAAHYGHLPLSEHFEWLASTPALVMLGTAAAAETLAYYVPGVDHALDVIASPAALVAGIVASAAVMTDLPPGILWPVAVIGGGGIATLTKGGTALVRAKSGLMTGGLANPVVSTAETIGATGLALFAIVLPVLALLLVVVLLAWAWRKTRRLLGRRAPADRGVAPVEPKR
ncbi:MAG TPA: DUF4126 domain-containing protein [Steroidobacteraceae bacterium]|nr:DUF4126 domain-containing protein [Steroidobacteraceae bacterium]